MFLFALCSMLYTIVAILTLAILTLAIITIQSQQYSAEGESRTHTGYPTRF